MERTEDLFLFVGNSKIIRRNGHECGSEAIQNILVLDGQGRLHYNVLFVICECESQVCTLLRHGFWASTPSSPRVAISVQLLKTTTLLMVESAVSTKAYVQMLRWKNDWSQYEDCTSDGEMDGSGKPYAEPSSP